MPLSRFTTTGQETLPTRVAVLEDQDIVRKHVVATLQASGLEVVAQARNLAEAEEFLRLDFDVALFDLALPDGTSFDLISRISAQTNAVVLVLSALDDAKSVMDALASGATGYVLKSAQGFEIGSAIEFARQGETPISPAIARFLLTQMKPLRSPLDHLGREQKLSKREREVLREVANGLTRKEIARKYGLSPYTIAEYLANIYKKYQVNNKSAAVAQGLARRDI